MMAAARRRAFVVAAGIGDRVNRRLVVSLAWTLSTLTLLGLAATLWLDRLLGQTGYPELAYL